MKAPVIVDREKQKDAAVKLMTILDIYKPYVRSFKAKKTTVCLYEGFGGFWLDQYPELMKKKQQIEEESGCLVYAVTHNKIYEDDVYSFLAVSSSEDEWENKCLFREDGYYSALAYVWNKTDDYCSEWGLVGVISKGGGIARIY